VQEPGERLGPLGRVELQVKHQVLRVAGGLADGEAAHPGFRGVSAKLSNAFCQIP
jgi:hypothetical protein